MSPIEMIFTWFLYVPTVSAKRASKNKQKKSKQNLSHLEVTKKEAWEKDARDKKGFVEEVRFPSQN